MSFILILAVVVYPMIAALVWRDVKKALGHYKLTRVSAFRWTLREPNGRFAGNLQGIWDLANRGARL